MPVDVQTGRDPLLDFAVEVAAALARERRRRRQEARRRAALQSMCSQHRADLTKLQHDMQATQQHWGRTRGTGLTLQARAEDGSAAYAGTSIDVL